MKKIYLVLIFYIAATCAFAQSITNVQYSMGFGTGDLSDFIGKPSFRGITVDFRKMVQPNLGVGFELGWNVFTMQSFRYIFCWEFII